MSFDNVNINVSGGQSIIKALQNYNTIILKPNIIDNRNVLTQEMISEKHTKYVIKWNYSLEDATINIPKDCIIEFAGGTIDNGTIIGNNTILIYSKPIDEVCPAKRQGTFIYNTTVADEEDITSESGQLKFKDRPTTNGMGRKILRKNIVNEVNTLTKSMINKPNTIYVIQYDFTLGEDITIPANCVLDFNGGCINANDNYYLTGKILNDYIDIRWLGIDGNNITSAFKQALKLCTYIDSTSISGNHPFGKNTEIYIPSGIWQCDSIVFSEFVGKHGCTILGERSFNHRSNHRLGTVICPLRSSQTYIWKTGERSETIDMTGNVDIRNITFSDYTDDGIAYNKAILSDGALWICDTEFSYFDDLVFTDITGIGLKINNSWELTFGTLTLRSIYSVDYPAVLFGDSANNISQCYFNYISIEAIDGDIFKITNGCGFNQNIFNCISGEWYPASNKITLENKTDEEYENAVPFYVFNIANAKCTINIINLHRDNINQVGGLIDGTLYACKGIFKAENGCFISCTSLSIDAINNEVQSTEIINNGLSCDFVFGNIDVSNYNSAITVDDCFKFNVSGLSSLSIANISVSGVNLRRNRSQEWNRENNPCLYTIRGNSRNQGCIFYNKNIPSNFHLGINNGQNQANCAILNPIYIKTLKGLHIYIGTQTGSNIPVRQMFFNGVSSLAERTNAYIVSNNNIKGEGKLSVAQDNLLYDLGINEFIAGVTSYRPTLDAAFVGFKYFDVTLGKPIWWNGTEWVDAIGTTV